MSKTIKRRVYTQKTHSPPVIPQQVSGGFSSTQVLEYLSRIRGEMDTEVEKLRVKVRALEVKVYKLEVENDILIRMMVWGRVFKNIVLPKKYLQAHPKAKEKKPTPGGWTVFALMYRILKSKYQLSDDSGKPWGKLVVYQYHHDGEGSNADSQSK